MPITETTTVWSLWVWPCRLVYKIYSFNWKQSVILYWIFWFEFCFLFLPFILSIHEFQLDFVPAVTKKWYILWSNFYLIFIVDIGWIWVDDCFLMCLYCLCQRISAEVIVWRSWNFCMYIRGFFSSNFES